MLIIEKNPKQRPQKKIEGLFYKGGVPGTPKIMPLSLQLGILSCPLCQLFIW